MTGMVATLSRMVHRRRWRCDLTAWMRDDKKLAFRNVLNVKRVRWGQGDNSLALRVVWSDGSRHVGYVPVDGIRTLAETWTPRYPLNRIRERVGM